MADTLEALLKPAWEHFEGGVVLKATSHGGTEFVVYKTQLGDYVVRGDSQGSGVSTLSAPSMKTLFERLAQYGIPDSGWRVVDSETFATEREAEGA